MKKNNLNVVLLEPVYTDDLKDQLKEKTKQYGEFSFDDEAWYCSKRHKNANEKHVFTLRFHMINEKYKADVKYYALMCNNAITTIQSKIYSLDYFLKYIQKYQGIMQLGEIDRKVMVQFEEHLRIEKADSIGSAKEIYASIYDFFNKLSEFPEFPEQNPCKRANPFKTRRTRKDEKYIPKEVVQQYDRIMKNHEIELPLEVRTLYWLLRSFPNRITEALSIKQNCLKTLYSFYVLNIPTYKQNGGYDIEEIKTIPIVDSGHGRYIIQLLKEAVENANHLTKHGSVEEMNKNYLFLTTNWTLTDLNGKLKVINRSPKKNPLKAKMLTPHMFKSALKKIAVLYNIRDKEGNIYVPTSHQFRHNAITDRLYLGGYTVEQATKLTGHKGTGMISASYSHQLKEKHKEILLKTADLKDPSHAPVAFKGSIMNLDEKTTTMLSKNPKAYLTWEANKQKGVGMCSDILGCNPKGTSVHFECYSCDWFVPKADYLDDYKREMDYWEKIISDSKDNPKRAAHFENAIRNVTLLERLVQICENGIDSYKKEIKVRKQGE